MAEPRTRMQMFLETVVGAFEGSIRHGLRAHVLEQATVLEFAMDEVLAASLAVDLEADETLRADVLWRLPIPERIKMLSEMMQRRELSDRWPFVVPVLRQLFELRHQLAHGIVSVVGTPDPAFTLVTVKRGRTRMDTYSGDYLNWLIWESGVAQLELQQIWAAVVPASSGWFGLAAGRHADGSRR